jgi:addiction module RelE/StbE family toxin
MLFIANDARLGPEWLDHSLKGDWVDHRKCRTGGDFLLIYQVEGCLQAPQKKSVVIFTVDTLASHRYAGHGYKAKP